MVQVTPVARVTATATSGHGLLAASSDRGHERFHAVDQPSDVGLVHRFDDLGNRSRVAGADTGISPYPAPCSGDASPALDRSAINARSAGPQHPALEAKTYPGGGGVDGVTEGAEMGPLPFQGLDHLQQMGDRTREAVDPDDLENVACLHLPNQPGQLGPGPTGAGRLFHHENVKTVLPQLVGLWIEILGVGGDARVSEYLAHGSFVQNTEFKANG